MSRGDDIEILHVDETYLDGMCLIFATFFMEVRIVEKEKSCQIVYYFD